MLNFKNPLVFSLLLVSLISCSISSSSNVALDETEGRIIFSASPMYDEQIFAHSFEEDALVQYTKSKDNHFEFEGGGIHFTFTNNSDKDVTILSTTLDVEKIELDETEVCLIGYQTEFASVIYPHEPGGSLYINVRNMGWGKLAPGTLSVQIPAEYQRYFSQAEYCLNTEMLEPVESMDIILIDAADIIEYPEIDLTIRLAWEFQTPSSIIKSDPLPPDGYQNILRKDIILHLGSYGMHAYMGAFGFSDSPSIQLDPDNTDRTFTNDKPITIPAKTTIGLFSRISAYKSCYANVKLIFELDDGSECTSPIYSAHYAIPLFKEEAFSFVSETALRDEDSRPLWMVVSPLDVNAIEQVK